MAPPPVAPQEDVANRLSRATRQFRIASLPARGVRGVSACPSSSHEGHPRVTVALAASRVGIHHLVRGPRARRSRGMAAGDAYASRMLCAPDVVLRKYLSAV